MQPECREILVSNNLEVEVNLQTYRRRRILEGARLLGYTKTGTVATTGRIQANI